MLDELFPTVLAATTEVSKPVIAEPGKSTLLQVKQNENSPERPYVLQEVEGPEFQNETHMKVVRSSALDTGHHYPQEILLIVLSVRE